MTFHAQALATQEPLRPRHLFLLTPLTLLYLLFECAFNARLLDVTGGLASQEEIDILEKVGRLISGVALTLFMWGQWLLPRAEQKHWSLRKSGVLFGGSAFFCILFMFWLQKALIDWIVDGSNGTSRRIAVQLRLVTHSVMKENLKIDGIDLAPEVLHGPAGKSFMALLPFMAFSTEALDLKVENVLRQLFRTSIEKERGTPEEAYNRVFIPSVEALQKLYNVDYAQAVARYRQALLNIPQHQEKAWADYETGLRTSNMEPSSVPQEYWSSVREELVRKKRLQLPVGWNPADRKAFDAAIERKVQRNANAVWNREIQKLLGPGQHLPRNLNRWERFSAHPQVQKKWRELLKLEHDFRLSHDLSFEDFVDHVYEPQVSSEIEKNVRKVMAHDSEFADGGQQVEAGRAAMQALTVPPLALAFSLLGALVHVFKSANFLVRLTAPRLRFRAPFLMGCVTVLALSAFLVPNDITRSRVFGYMSRQTSERFSWPVAAAVRWIVQAQPFFYPLNEDIRVEVLGGIRFGYHPKQAVSPQR